MVPGAQIVGLIAPVGQAEPAGHDVQSDCSAPPVELRWLPAAHAVGALAPAAQNEPATQSTHAVVPLADWYVPEAHTAQMLWLGAAA